MTKSQSGFSPLIIIVVLAVVGIIGFAGWRILSPTEQPSTQTSESPAKSTTKKTETAADASSEAREGELVITEWGVVLKPEVGIQDATYHLIGSTAWLSTKQLDAIPDCQYNGPYYQQRTYQGIIRHDLNEKIQFDSSDPNERFLSAKEAANKYPQTFKQVGNYVYEYTHGNGQFCEGADVAVINKLGNLLPTIAARPE